MLTQAVKRTVLRTNTRAFGSSMRLCNKKIIDDDLMDKADAATDDGSGARESKWKDTAKKSREESEFSRQRNWRGMLFTGVLGAGVLGYFMRPFDEEEQKHYKNVEATALDPMSLWNRCYTRFTSTFDSFKEPIAEKLLPDPQPNQPMTLVLSVDDLLVKSSWSREFGWRTAKRPGVDYFLGYLAQFYEIVLFSDKYTMYGQDIAEKLDPYRTCVTAALFREAARYDNGQLIKDLSHLNRDLNKVIAVDVDPKALGLQPDNALIIPKWKGNKDDVDLIRLLNVLEYIATQNARDVRPMLRTLESNGDPLGEFEKRDKAYRESIANRRSPKIGSLIGHSGAAPGQTHQDTVRRSAQRNYVKMKEYIEEQGKKMMEEEKKLLEEHGKTSLSKMITQSGPSQQELEAALMKRMEEKAQEGK